VLWWVDIEVGRLHRFDPADGADTFWQMPSMLGCVGLHGDSGVVCALQDGFYHFDPGSAERRALITAVAPGAFASRFNDGVVSPGGRFLCTTMRAHPPFDEPDQWLAVLGRGGALAQLVDGLRIGNGLAFSPDGAVLYLSESHRLGNCIWAFDWHEDEGRVSNRRSFFAFADMPGHPDGAAVDVEGCYWTACAYGWRVLRITPAGVVDRIVPVPVEKPTKIAFGGARLDTIYLTSIGKNLAPGSAARQPHAGGVFAFHPGVTGLPAARFRP
jgi:sugar lactone lactonase YvrE